jgi:hypothetical protein
MIAIWLVMLVALVGLGSLAAVVFAIVYAIANKKPGVALAAVLLPLGAITTVGVLTALFVGRASYQVQGPVHADIHYAIDAPPSPPSPPQISVPQIIDPPTHLRMSVLFLPVAVLIAAFLMFRKHGCKSGNWSWGKMLAVGMLLFLVANFLFMSASRRVEVVHGQQQAAIDHAEQVRLDVENAERKAFEAEQAVEDAQRKAEEAVEDNAAIERGIEFKSMQELWEKLNQPRIKLESGDDGASVEAGVDGKIVTIEAPVAGEAKMIVPIGSETPESLARSLARLERMVEQVSAMADQVSDAGTLVGKAMVALNETIDTRGKEKMKVETVAAVVEKTPAPRAVANVPLAMEQQVRGGSVPSRIEIRVNDEQARELNLSVNDITKALTDGYGFWQFQVSNGSEGVTTVRAIGEPTEGFASTAPDIVVGHVGKQQKSVHLGDVATIVDVTPQLTGKTTRPSWVDVPAKRVGNAQRRVIVAGDFTTREECDREADRLLMLATAEHLSAITGTPLAQAPAREVSLHDGSVIYPESDPRLYLLQRMNVGLDYVRREIAKDEYEETVELSFGPMKRLYTRVEFTPSVDNELRTRWDEFRREKRFAMVGMGAGSVLGLLGMAFGLLKVDTWTKGYYTKRLFIGVPAVIIGGFTLLLFIK